MNNLWLKRLISISNYSKKFNCMPIVSILIYKNFELSIAVNYKSNFTLHAEKNTFTQSLFYFPKNIIKKSTLYINLRPCSLCMHLINKLGLNKLVFLSFKENKNLYNNILTLYLRPTSSRH